MTRTLPIIAAYLAISLQLLIFCKEAQAQEHPRVHLLALTCVAEAGFSAQDCDAIMYVLRRRSRQRGESITRHAVLYSSLWRKPDLPGRVREAIERHPDKWRATLDRVRAFLRGEVRDPCPSARHFGDARGDLVRAQRAGWTPVDCGKTANLFWR